MGTVHDGAKRREQKRKASDKYYVLHLFRIKRRSSKAQQSLFDLLPWM